MENGLISVNRGATKKDISEAPSFISKQKQIKLENELLYSSYKQLYDRIQSYLLSDDKELKEETNSWI